MDVAHMFAVLGPVVILTFLWQNKETLFTTLRFLKKAGNDGGYAAVIDVTLNNERRPTKLWLPVNPYSATVIGSYDDVKHVLTRGPYVKSEELRRRLSLFLGQSLLNSNTTTPEEREEVYAQKRAIGRMVNSDAADAWIEKLADEFVATVEAKAGHPAFDIIPLIEKFTFSVMLAVIFGKELDKEEEKVFKEDVDEMLVSSGLLLNVPLYEFMNGSAFLDTVEKVRMYIRKHIKEGCELYPTEGVKHPIDMYQSITLAGYGTVTTLLGTTLLDNCQGEAGAAMQREVAEAADEKVARELAEQMLWKSGGRHPPAPTLNLVAEKEDTLPSGTVISKGGTVLVSLVAAEKDTKEHTMFSLGARSCTGKKVAMKMLIVALAKLLARCELRVGHTEMKKKSIVWDLDLLEVTVAKRS